MTTSFWVTAILTGLLGSAHCIGMCGPIALALPSDPDKKRSIANLLLYNLSRAFAYSMLGLLPGLLGLGMQMAGISQKLSIAAGVLMLLVLVLGFNQKVERYVSQKPLYQKIQKIVSGYFSGNKKTNFLLLGFFNGLLPCGLVYMALALAVGAGGLWQSALFMFIFGLGTLPAMFTLSLSSAVIPLSWRNKLRRFVPYSLLFIGLLLILRGMNLGIPYLSPKIKPQGQLECCKPK